LSSWSASSLVESDFVSALVVSVGAESAFFVSVGAAVLLSLDLDSLFSELVLVGVPSLL